MSAKSKKLLSNTDLMKSIKNKLHAINFNVPESFLFRLEEGDPWTFMSIYLHIFFDYSMSLSDRISKTLGPEIFQHKHSENTDSKKAIINSTCIDALFTILADVFNYKPKITPEKFVDPYLYTEEKISMLLDILNLCDKVVNSNKK